MQIKEVLTAQGILHFWHQNKNKIIICCTKPKCVNRKPNNKQSDVLLVSVIDLHPIMVSKAEHKSRGHDPGAIKILMKYCRKFLFLIVDST